MLLSTDPVRFTPSTPQMFNRYAYVNNDPVNGIDPDGNQAATLEPIKVGVKIVKAGAETSAIFAKEFVALKIESKQRSGDATFRGGDQQAHFVANAKASARSPLHEAFAKVISDKREEIQLSENPTESEIAAGELDQAANGGGREFGKSLRPVPDTKAGNKATDTVSRAAGEDYVQENVNPDFVDERVK